MRKKMIKKGMQHSKIWHETAGKRLTWVSTSLEGPFTYISRISCHNMNRDQGTLNITKSAN